MARQQVAAGVALLLALLTSFRGNYCQLLPLEHRVVRRLMERCYRRRAALMRLQLLLEQVEQVQHLQIYAGLKLQLVEMAGRLAQADKGAGAVLVVCMVTVVEVETIPHQVKQAAEGLVVTAATVPIRELLVEEEFLLAAGLLLLARMGAAVVEVQVGVKRHKVAPLEEKVVVDTVRQEVQKGSHLQAAEMVLRENR